jgi:hypothetical protein
MRTALTGATDVGMEHYTRALHELRCLIGDPVASVDSALDAAPDFVMAYALRAYLHLLGTEPAGIPVARASLELARSRRSQDAEQGHLAAIEHLVNGRWHAAGRVLEDVAIADPLDALALQVGHQIDFFTGQARMLRDRIARALPAWDAGMPGYHALLGMHAFGLEEMGDYAQAEAQGRLGIELERRDTWAQHAVAHVLEMQGRLEDGIAWMNGNLEDWSNDSFLSVHNWWHLALYHLERGETDQVLALYDGPIRGGQSSIVLEMVDASALLWRLALRGIVLGDRWNPIAEQWAPLAGSGNYAFNDAHAMMAFMGAGRDAAAEAVLAAQQEAMARDDDNAMFTREVGHPVARAIQAFHQGNYAEAIALLRPVRGIANRFGGSHAQRDVVDLTLLEAAFRASEEALAAALTAERLALKPASPLAALFARRAGLMPAAGRV